MKRKVILGVCTCMALSSILFAHAFVYATDKEIEKGLLEETQNIDTQASDQINMFSNNIIPENLYTMSGNTKY